MPTKREITVDELRFYTTFSSKQTLDFSEISQAVAAGKSLELIQSTFSDPGADYSEIRLDGRVLLRVNGY